MITPQHAQETIETSDQLHEARENLKRWGAVKSKWTQFWDMHSGGGTKEKWEQIYIEAPNAEAKVILYNRFKHNPERISCTCCGEDYSISESDSLEEATEFQRSRSTTPALADYINKPDVLIIRAEDIKPWERIGEVPEQGFVWKD